MFFDNNATTPILPEVIAAMLDELDGVPRNPSSITKYGREGRARVAQARKTIADLFGVTPNEVIFTSGATESNLLHINGFYKLNPGHIITSTIEHSCVLRPLENLNAEVTKIEVGPHGAPTPEDVLKAIKPNTSFLMLTGANNETGVKIDLDAMCQIAREKNIPLVLDGVVLLGREKIFPLPKEIAAISFSGHKIHGPKGSGISIIRKKYRIPPLFSGGHQEHGMRAGTENTAAILGLAKAIELIDESQFAYLANLRDAFEEGLREEGVAIEINGEGPRVPNTTNIHFTGKDAEMLTIRLDQEGLMATLGSACSAGTIRYSHVLKAMGYEKKRLFASMRFSFSRLNTLEEVKEGVQLIKKLTT